jgi:hypothetical protein
MVTARSSRVVAPSPAALRRPAGDKVSPASIRGRRGGARQVHEGGGSPMRADDGEAEEGSGQRRCSGAPHWSALSPTARHVHGGGEVHGEVAENSSRAMLTEEGRSVAATASSPVTARVLQQQERTRGKGVSWHSPSQEGEREGEKRTVGDGVACP